MLNYHFRTENGVQKMEIGVGGQPRRKRCPLGAQVGSPSVYVIYTEVYVVPIQL